eukprot:COSAG05_NODE_5713_length_1109_cov_3.311881_3_plen_164_part_01
MNNIGQASQQRIWQLVRDNEPNKARAESISQRILLNAQQWSSAAALLEVTPALLTHGDTPLVEHADMSLLVPHLSAPMVERVLATAPRVAQQLDEGQRTTVAQALASSTLAAVNLYVTPLDTSARAALALLARDRQLPTLVWAGLQLGDGGAQQLVAELAGGDE